MPTYYDEHGQPLDKKPTKAEKREDILNWYRDQLRCAIEYRKCFEPVWERCVQAYAHRFESTKIGFDACEDRIAVNMVLPLINIQMAVTSLEKPHFALAPRQPLGRGTDLRLTEEVLNFWWNQEWDMNEEHRLAFKDSLLIGHGWTKVGWQFEQAEFERSEEELQSEVDRELQAVSLISDREPDVAHALLTEEEIRENLDSIGFRILQDHPTYERVSPWDMWVDPFATRMRNATWICQRVVRPINEIRTDESLDKKVREGVNGIESDGQLWSPHEEADRARNDKGGQWGVYYEMWDLRRGTFSLFTLNGSGNPNANSDGFDGIADQPAEAEGEADFLYGPVPIPMPFSHPFIFQYDHEIPDRFYPLGEVEAILDQQYELNEIRTQQLRALQKWRRQWMVQQSLASNQKFRQAVESKEADILIPIPDGQWEEIGEVGFMTPLPTDPIPNDAYAMDGRVQEDIYNITGTTDYESGGAPAARTATEAAIVASGSQARTAEKLARLERSMEKGAAKILALAQRWLQTRQPLTVIGNFDPFSQQGQQPQFEQFDRNTIRGDYLVTIEAGSTVPLSDVERRQRAVELVTSVVPLSQIPEIGQLVNWSALFMHLLEEGFGLKNPERFLRDFQQSAQNPFAQQLAAQAAPAGASGPATVSGGSTSLGSGLGGGGNQQFPTAQVAENQLAGQVGLPPL